MIRRLLAISATLAILLWRLQYFLIFPVNHFVNDTMQPGVDQPYSWTPNHHDLNAPYGVTWIVLTRLVEGAFVWLPFPRDVRFSLATLLIDQAFLIALSFWRGRWLLAYAPISILQWANAPWNMPVLWVTLAGLKWIPSLALGIATKLPVGSFLVSHSWASWQYALSMGQTWHRGIDSWELYGTLAVLWLAILVSQLHNRLVPRINHSQQSVEPISRNVQA